MRKMTVTEGLVELKLLGNRIEKASDRELWVAAARKTGNDVNGIEKETYKKQVKASFESAMALIKNRAAIKSAIVKSNAVTMVTINGKKMTVAEAIERKDSIKYERYLLGRIEGSYAAAQGDLAKSEIKIEDVISRTMQGSAPGESNGAEQVALMEAFRKANEWEIVDPLGIDDVIKQLTDDIDGFEAEVDTALSVSNATTMIEVE